MNVRELLQFVIEADSRQAVRAFSDVEAASAKSLGAAETRAQKTTAMFTKVGAGALAFGAIAAVGLYKTATAAGSLELSMDRLNGIFGQSATKVREFVKDANKFGLSDQQAAQYAAAIGEAAVGLGLSADEAGRLTPQLIEVVAQLGILNGMDTAAAMETVNAAMRGEYDSLQRLVPAISNATIVQQAMNETGKTTEAQLSQEEKTRAALNLIIEKGTLTLKRSDGAMQSLAGRTAIAKANFQDAITSFGAGALPAIEVAISALGGLAKAFNAIPEGTRGALGGIAAVVTAISLGGGAVSLAIGQYRKLSDALQHMGEGGGMAAAALNKLGQAALIYTAVATVGALIAELDDDAGMSAEQVDKLTESFKELEKTSGTIDFDKVLPEGHKLADVADDLKTTFDTLTDPSWAQNVGNMVEEIGSTVLTFGKIDTAADKAKKDLDGIDDALSAVATTNGPLASRIFEQLRNQLIAQGVPISEVSERLGGYSDTIKLNSELARENAKAQTTQGLQSAQNADVYVSTEQALKAYNDELKESNVVAESAAAAASAFGEALERGTNLDDAIEGAADMGDAWRDFREVVKDLPKELDLTKLSLGEYNEEQSKSVEAFLKVNDSAQDYLSTLIEQGESAEVVHAAGQRIVDSLTATMKQAGFTDEQIKAYQTTLGLTKEQIDTAITISGDALAYTKLSILQGQIDKLDEGAQAEITALILAGDPQAAVAKMQEELRRYTLTIAVQPRISWPGLGSLGAPRAPRTAAAGRAMAGAFAGPAGQTAGAGSYSNITINMPAGADGTQIVNALRRYEKRNGNPNRGWRPT